MNELLLVLGKTILAVAEAVGWLAVGLAVGLGLLGFLGFLVYLGFLGLGVLIGVRPNMNCYVTEPLELKKLRKAAMLENPASEVLCRPEKAQLMKLLIRKAKSVLVIGFSTGYYTLSMAMSLPPDGKVVVCDITNKLYLSWSFFQEANVANKVVFKTGTAIGCLDDLLATGYGVEFDLVFIDVNMILEDNSYEYYEYYWRSLALLRQGGLLVLNAARQDKLYEVCEYYWRPLALVRQGGLRILNLVLDFVISQVLSNDRVCGPQERTAAATLQQLHDLNIKVHEDTNRVDVVMDLTHAGSDGVMIAEKL